MQIGEVADATGLSLRTIRHYEDVGLVRPSARSKGGFRLYSADDVERLRLVRSLKPLEFTLEETRDLLGVLDALASPGDLGDVDGPAADRHALVDRLAMYRAAAVERVRALRAQLTVAEASADRLGDELVRHATAVPSRRGVPGLAGHRPSG
jgi:MerR family transcriptional regulator, copper efflux regulator